MLNEYKRFRTVDKYSQTMPFVIRKDTYEKVGGYSEEFPLYCSDHDFMMKVYGLSSNNKDNFLCSGKSLVYHFGSRSKK